MKRLFVTAILLYLYSLTGISQTSIQSLLFNQPESFTIRGISTLEQTEINLPYELPLFSVLIDSNFYNSYCSKPLYKKDEIHFIISDSIKGLVQFDKKFRPGLRITVRFTNNGKGNHKIENLVPLGEGNDKVYITAEGTMEWPQYLCRSKLYRPGYGPVGVVLPDNVWHLGFSDFKLNNDLSLTGLSRRGQRDKERTSLDRWAVTLKSGGWIEYDLYFDIHTGEWQEGLKMIFQDRWVYDLQTFDETLFNRRDLTWMRSKYIMLLQFAWDTKFYDYADKKYNFYDNLCEFDSLTGGYDIFTLWPTWPRLGLDQRNQWDMYRDLPGGLSELHRQSEFTHKLGKKYFISYNPWDEGTRKEDQMKGMEYLLRAINADGVVLDTRGSSSKELQETADKVRPGIIMYSEGMAIPKDMPGIVAGRVHDALVMPPPLNLNKLIKPDFAIFRVLQIADDRLHRELAISFFNGYGVEINTMRPGRPAWIREEFEYMGKTTKILRENDPVFHNRNWTPLIPALVDSVYINRWISDNKILYTIYSNNPDGWDGPLFELDNYSVRPGNSGEQVRYHPVDLWNHIEIDTIMKSGKVIIPVNIQPFDHTYLNTRREGNVGCIVFFPSLLDVRMTGDSLYFKASRGEKIVITGENPSYSSIQKSFSISGNAIPIWDYFNETTEKVVVQLFEKNELLDEKVFFPVHNLPRLISKSQHTVAVNKAPPEMVTIPSGTFRFYTKRDPNTLDPFIPFPDHSDTAAVKMEKFFMDKYPVTNRLWDIFLKNTSYVPEDTTNYLKHWINGSPPAGQEDYPVVFVNLDDIKAFLNWSLKRLPTEVEWQYAAQGYDSRKYPWGNLMDSTRCNYKLNHSTSVGSFPKGASLFGVEDMIGNVWQMTGDVYFNGCYYYNIIRGGSYYHPTSSIWYVTGGPLPADHPEMLLLISPGLDRNATVGFRCVMDAEH